MKVSRIYLLVAIVAVASCSYDYGARREAPFPGASYALADKERDELEKKVVAGDTAAARRLADYFFLFDGNEREGIHWLEKAGDMGDIEARAIVLGFLGKGGAEDKRRALELEERWGCCRS